MRAKLSGWKHLLFTAATLATLALAAGARFKPKYRAVGSKGEDPMLRKIMYYRSARRRVRHGGGRGLQAQLGRCAESRRGLSGGSVQPIDPGASFVAVEGFSWLTRFR